MKFGNFKEIIDFAIQKEKEAAEFYEQASQEESMSGAKQMFKEFAEIERKHQKMLENLDKQQVKTFKPEKIMDLKRSDYLEDMEFKKGMSYRDILTIGMKREENAAKMYADLAARSDNQEFKKVFLLLQQEEAKHKLGLETLYDDYMSKMGD